MNWSCSKNAFKLKEKMKKERNHSRSFHRREMGSLRQSKAATSGQRSILEVQPQTNKNSNGQIVRGVNQQNAAQTSCKSLKADLPLRWDLTQPRLTLNSLSLTP